MASLQSNSTLFIQTPVPWQFSLRLARYTLMCLDTWVSYDVGNNNKLYEWKEWRRKASRALDKFFFGFPPEKWKNFKQLDGERSLHLLG